MTKCPRCGCELPLTIGYVKKCGVCGELLPWENRIVYRFKLKRRER